MCRWNGVCSGKDRPGVSVGQVRPEGTGSGSARGHHETGPLVGPGNVIEGGRHFGEQERHEGEVVGGASTGACGCGAEVDPAGDIGPGGAYSIEGEVDRDGDVVPGRRSEGDGVDGDVAVPSVFWTPVIGLNSCTLAIWKSAFCPWQTAQDSFETTPGPGGPVAPVVPAAPAAPVAPWSRRPRCIRRTSTAPRGLIQPTG